MQTANRLPQGPNPEHMCYPQLFSLPLAPADDRGVPPPRGHTHSDAPSRCLHARTSALHPGGC